MDVVSRATVEVPMFSGEYELVDGELRIPAETPSGIAVRGPSPGLVGGGMVEFISLIPEPSPFDGSKLRFDLAEGDVSVVFIFPDHWEAPPPYVYAIIEDGDRDEVPVKRNEENLLLAAFPPFKPGERLQAFFVGRKY